MTTVYQSKEKNNATWKTKEGFTLFEIIMVIALIGIIMGAVVPRIMKYMADAKIKTAANAVVQVQTSILAYQTDVGDYPATLEDLVRRPTTEPAKDKWQTGGYMKKEQLMDPWGKKLVYKLNPPESEPPYELYSYGPNGSKGKKEERINAKF
jgi:general secretion pathway protein G